MRILHVTPTYFPATRYGGPIYSVHGLASAQAQRGDDVRVFTTNVDGPGVSDAPLGAPVDLDGVRVTYFPCGVGRRLYRSPQMALALEDIVHDIDVMHLHAAFLWPPLAAARIARKAGVPYVHAPRGMLSPELVRAKSGIVKALWITLFERRTIAEAAALHVTSAAEHAGVERLGLKASRIAVIPNGVDLPALERTETPDATILCLGRISWKKGLDRLIRAFALTKDARLIIAGNDDERLSPALRHIASELGVGSRVRFDGPVAGEEKWRLMRSSTIFALASHSENFGNAVLEAMACGLPVVVTPEVGLAETVASSGAGLVAAGDPENFGRALRDLLADGPRRIAMGAAGRHAAKTRFSWRVIADEMDALYSRIVAR